MVSIRNTVREEAELLAQIQQRAFAPLYERYHDSGNPALRGVEDVLRRLDTPVFRNFTVLEDGEIVGGILYRCEGRVSFCGKLQKGEYYLQRVYILPERQGRHIAQTAIRLCEEQFPDAKTFYVDFPEDMEKNRRCYEAAGFRDTGERVTVQPGLVLAGYAKQL